MRGDGGSDQRVVGETLEKMLGEAQRIRWRFGIRRRKPNDGLAQNAAHPALLRGFRNHVLEIIHIRECGCAAEQHFETRETGSPAHEVRGYVSGFGRENIFLELL